MEKKAQDESSKETLKSHDSSRRTRLNRNNSKEKIWNDPPKPKTTSKLPRIAHMSMKYQKPIVKPIKSSDDSGDSFPGPSKLENAPMKRDAEKLKLSHIPRLKYQKDGIRYNRPSTSNYNQYIPECRNVQRVNLFINPEFSTDDLGPPVSIQSTRPIPALGQLYGRINTIDSDRLNDFFTALGTPASILTSNDVTTNSNAPNEFFMSGSSSAGLSMHSHQGNLQRWSTIVLETHISTQKNLPREIEPTNEDDSGWQMTPDEELPTRDNESALVHKSLKNIHKSNTVTLKKSQQSQVEEDMTMTMTTNQIYCVAVSVENSKKPSVPKLGVECYTDTSSLQQQSTVVRCGTSDKPRVEEGTFTSKSHVCLKPSLLSKTKDANNNTGSTNEKRHTITQAPRVLVPSYTDCFSEVLQKTTNFEMIEGIASNKTPSSDTVINNEKLGNTTVIQTKDESEMCDVDDSTTPTSYNTNQSKSSDTTTTTTTTLLMSDATVTDWSYGPPGSGTFRHAMIKRCHEDSRHNELKDHCIKCQRFKRFPSSRYKLPARSFGSWRNGGSIRRLCCLRWNHVWKKTAERWATWSSKSVKSRRFRSNLVRSGLLADVDVQTTVVLFNDTGISAIREQKSAAISTMVNVGGDFQSISNQTDIEGKPSNVIKTDKILSGCQFPNCQPVHQYTSFNKKFTWKPDTTMTVGNSVKSCQYEDKAPPHVEQTTSVLEKVEVISFDIPTDTKDLPNYVTDKKTSTPIPTSATATAPASSPASSPAPASPLTPSFAHLPAPSFTTSPGPLFATPPAPLFPTPPASSFAIPPAPSFATQPAPLFAPSPALLFATSPAPSFAPPPASSFATQPAPLFATPTACSIVTPPACSFVTPPVCSFATPPACSIATSPAPLFASPPTSSLAPLPTTSFKRASSFATQPAPLFATPPTPFTATPPASSFAPPPASSFTTRPAPLFATPPAPLFANPPEVFSATLPASSLAPPPTPSFGPPPASSIATHPAPLFANPPEPFSATPPASSLAPPPLFANPIAPSSVTPLASSFAPPPAPSFTPPSAPSFATPSEHPSAPLSASSFTHSSAPSSLASSAVPSAPPSAPKPIQFNTHQMQINNDGCNMDAIKAKVIQCNNAEADMGFPGIFTITSSTSGCEITYYKPEASSDITHISTETGTEQALYPILRKFLSYAGTTISREKDHLVMSAGTQVSPEDSVDKASMGVTTYSTALDDRTTSYSNEAINGPLQIECFDNIVIQAEESQANPVEDIETQKSTFKGNREELRRAAPSFIKVKDEESHLIGNDAVKEQMAAQKCLTIQKLEFTGTNIMSISSKELYNNKPSSEAEDKALGGTTTVGLVSTSVGSNALMGRENPSNATMYSNAQNNVNASKCTSYTETAASLCRCGDPKAETPNPMKVSFGTDPCVAVLNCNNTSTSSRGLESYYEAGSRPNVFCMTNSTNTHVGLETKSIGLTASDVTKLNDMNRTDAEIQYIVQQEMAGPPSCRDEILSGFILNPVSRETPTQTEGINTFEMPTPHKSASMMTSYDGLAASIQFPAISEMTVKTEASRNSVTPQYTPYVEGINTETNTCYKRGPVAENLAQTSVVHTSQKSLEVKIYRNSNKPLQSKTDSQKSINARMNSPSPLIGKKKTDTSIHSQMAMKWINESPVETSLHQTTFPNSHKSSSKNVFDTTVVTNEANQIRKSNTSTLETDTYVCADNPVPYELPTLILSKDNLADVLPLIQSNDAHIKESENKLALMPTMVDVVTSDKVYVSKDVKEFMLQACPEICETEPPCQINKGSKLSIILKLDSYIKSKCVISISLQKTRCKK